MLHFRPRFSFFRGSPAPARIICRTRSSKTRVMLISFRAEVS